MTTNISRTTMLLGLVLGIAAVPAYAATSWTRDLSTGSTTGTAPGVSIDGYAGASNTGLLKAETPTNWGAGYGWGMYTEGESSSPEHALDNHDNTAASGNHYKESLLLTFGKAVTLSQLTVGWTSGDSDVSVLAYTGGGTPISTATSTYANLLSNGWTLVGQYANMVADASTAINAGGTTSSYWLIAAYNSVFLGTCSIAGQCDNGNDYVKVLAVAGTTPSNNVPEPSPLALLGLSLLGAIALRRRQNDAP